MSRAKKWCYTLNNPTDVELRTAEDLYLSSHGLVYHVYGKETGDSGTFHLQGFCLFQERKRLSTVRGIFQRAHWEAARGTPHQAADYCKKEGDFKEYGSLPPQTQGKRSDWERLREYVTELGRHPLQRDLILEFPALVARYPGAVRDYVSAVLPPVSLTSSVPRSGWQSELEERLLDTPDDRTVEFIIDAEGNTGKTWFCQYMLTKFPDKVQYLRIGKRDDLAYVIDETRTIFLFDVPRGQLQYLQYNILEQLKDRMIFSPKYASTVKILSGNPHVVVFTNEEINMAALSADRYRTTYVDSV